MVGTEALGILDKRTSGPEVHSGNGNTGVTTDNADLKCQVSFAVRTGSMQFKVLEEEWRGESEDAENLSFNLQHPPKVWAKVIHRCL